MECNSNFYKLVELRQKIFNLIYEEPDINVGINLALACIGESFGISRVYIFENNEANTHADNTFEWCAEGIMPEMDDLQNMSFEEYDYQSLFDENGLCFCPDVSQLPEMLKELFENQGIRATLQYAVYDKGVFRGFVGFDDCEKARPDWHDDGFSLETLIFLSRMSHDMRTPLNGILGLSALTEDEENLEVIAENMKKIRSSGEYLLGLINDILDFQKIETGKMHLNPQIVNGEFFTKDIIEFIRRFAEEKDISFKAEFLEEQLRGFIRIDPIRVKQICLNLLSNAIKFTPEHGNVTFKIQCEDISDKVRRVTFHVIDTGVGMSRQFLENGIYHSFSQEYNELSTENTSSGLGLSIVKRLIDMMNGTIEVYSELGKGTEFVVTLDVELIHQMTAHKISFEEEQRQSDIKNSLNGRKLLLVEDHPLNAEVAKRLLSKMGCEVFWAENGQVGVEYFEKSEHNFFDAILMDIRMPVMDGLTAARKIRALKRVDALTVPMIAMTANAYEEDRHSSMKAGMNYHLAKPIEPQKLYKTLASILDRS